MKKIRDLIFDKGNTWGSRVLLILMGLVAAVLVYYSLCYSSYIAVTYYEVVLNKKDSVIVNILCLIIAIIIMVGVGKLIEKKHHIGIPVLLGVVLLWSVILGCYWVTIANSLPCADQELVLGSAKMMLAGDYSTMLQGGYLYLYPHQIGLVAYYEIMMKLFHSGNSEIIQYANVFWNCVTIVAGYHIVKLMFKNNKITIYYLFLMAACLPLFFYTPFVYGEMISLALVFVEIWMMLLYLQTNKYRFAAIGILASCLAMAVRMNSIIVVMACVVMLVFMAMKRRKWKDLVVAVILLVLSLSTISAIQGIYEKRSGNEFGEGVPKLAHVAMGLQECVCSPGWSNSFNRITYVDSGYDQEITNQLSRESIEASKEKFKDLSYATWFFREKFTSQWNEPTYECFQMNSYHEEELGKAATSLYFGKWNEFLWSFMNRYQFVIYALLLTFVVAGIRKPDQMSTYVFLIAIMGGFLFHMLWEAKGRYTFPYMVMMVPYAAAGVAFLEQGIKMKIAGKTNE